MDINWMPKYRMGRAVFEYVWGKLFILNKVNRLNFS